MGNLEHLCEIPLINAAFDAGGSNFRRYPTRWRSGAVRAPAFAALRDDLCRYLFCAHASTVTLTVTSANKELEITGVLLLRMAEKVR